MIDLKGKRFGKLKVIYPKSKTKSGNIIWHCECECGKKTNVRAGDLHSKHTKSCGCLKYQPPEELKEGVLLSHLASTQAKKNNKSGYRGVTLHRKKFMARIFLKGKAYYLGVFPTAEEAYDKYLAVKEKLHVPLLEKYNYQPKKEQILCQ